MAKERQPIWFKPNGSMHDRASAFYSKRHPNEYHPLPADTEMRLDLEFVGCWYKGWWIFQTNDGRRFYLAPSEIKNLVMGTTLDHGRVSGKFGFTKKGSNQSLRWLHE